MNATLKRFHDIAYEISFAHKAMQCDNAEFEVIEKAGAEFKRLAGKLEGMRLEDATRTAVNAVRPVIRGILGLRTVSMLPVARRHWVGSFSKAEFEFVVKQWAAVPCELPRKAMLTIAEAAEREPPTATFRGLGVPPVDQGDISRTLLAIGDDTAVKVMVIANKSDLETEQKLVAISKLDERYFAWKSPVLAELLQVSSAMIRQTTWWKVTRKDWIRDNKDIVDSVNDD